MEGKYEEAKEKLKKHKQEQLLICYDQLIEQKREELLNQILKIDFEQIEELYKQTQHKKDFKDCKIEPLPYIDKQKLTEEERQRYETNGISKIKEGKYAVVTMAGGQGTRLRTQWSQRNLRIRSRRKNTTIYIACTNNFRSTRKISCYHSMVYYD